MQELVFDTSPLQAVWRSGLMDAVTQGFVTLVPRAVADETRHFVRGASGTANPRTRAERLRLAPDLDAQPRIRCVDVPRHDVDGAMRCFFGRPYAVVVQYKGDVYAWADKPSASVGLPELEVVALAAARNAIAVIDDHKGLRVAEANSVLTATTRELFDELATRDQDIDLARAFERIVATGYEPTKRRSAKPTFGHRGPA
jgi:hypothetical protein